MQITLSTYARMGVWECVADTLEEYINIAVRMATDSGFKQRIVEKIIARKELLFETQDSILQWDHFIQAIVEKSK